MKKTYITPEALQISMDASRILNSASDGIRNLGRDYNSTDVNYSRSDNSNWEED